MCGVCGWGGQWLPVSEVAGWKVVCQLNGPVFLFFCVFAKLSVSGREFSLLGGMLLLAIGLCPAYMPFPLFHRALENQIVLGRGIMKGGKGQVCRSGLSWDHVILLSAGSLFLVNMSVGSDSCCCAGDSAAHPTATFIIAITHII